MCGCGRRGAFDVPVLTTYARAHAVHSWDYRRYLLTAMATLPPSDKRPNPTTSSELAYTTRKISANFSNFSAWHYRTKLLQKLWEENEWGEEDESRLARIDEGMRRCSAVRN